ncbi:MATE family efflux transporter [Clostridium sp. AM58-1XD]|uniref:MATE family efflux transporter n=1 Tax=Clostridium sp. AM58-1XD TaxID=2292307 RepID=UPI00325BF10C
MEKENPMGTKPVLPLLLGMSFPPMVSMLIQSMYNVVDSIYLASYSKEALTAVSLVFPLQNLVLAVAVGFGIGINSCMSRSLGEKNTDETNRIAAHGVICSLIHSLIFVLAGLFLSGPFIAMFTNNQEIYEMGCTYSRIVICLSFASIFHIFIEKIFQAVGNMVVPMFLQAAGALVNIILDPILIFGQYGFPSMGITGLPPQQLSASLQHV